MRRSRPTVLATLAVAALLFAGCGSDDGDDVSSDSVATTESTTTSAPATTEAATTEATETTEAPATEPDDGSDPEPSDTTSTAPASEPEDPAAGLSPGDPCSLEEGVPDCIDPDGDGEGVYLTGGAQCAATAVDISVCEDGDGDGVAGQPDEYADLPTCSAEQPPPCNNPDDPDAEDQG